MHGRQLAGVAAGLAVTVSALGCRASEVSVGFSPEIGDRYEYHYEIDATITRQLEGAEPEVIELDTELTAEQEVRATTRSGARIRVTLTREGGAPRTAVVLVDRAGSLRGVELIEGLAASVFGIADAQALVPTHLDGPPDGPLEPGDRWTIDDGARHGHGRLVRLGVVDDEDVAVVRTSITEELDESLTAGASDSDVTGTLRAGSTTSYDLGDGAIRRSRSWSEGELDVLVAPPPGVDAEPVGGTISFDVVVRVTRTG